MGRVLTGVALYFTVLGVAGAGQGPEAGTITGLVRLTTRVRGTPLPSNVYPSRSVGRHEAGTTPEIKNVVVYLTGVTSRGPLTPSRHAIRQEHEAFVPRVLAITRGSTVDFPNADPYFHNVFSLSSAGTFNLGRYPKGETKGREFTKPGLVKVYCNIHSHMSASILVLDHPYFTIPELDGTFKLSNVPPGRYTIVGWHERVGERTSPILVQAGGLSTIELSLPIEDAP